MTTAIVITSIFELTEAVKRYARLPGYQLVVVGDRKTLSSWSCENAVLPAKVCLYRTRKSLRAIQIRYICGRKDIIHRMYETGYLDNSL
jgi:hypothetical protein